MNIKQLSVFVENKPGRLAEITGLLCKNNIDIRALSVADTTNFGILRLIVDKPSAAEQALKNSGFTVSQTDVISIGVDDKPGGLAQAMALLSQENITVEYMYAFVSREEKTAYVILRVDNNERATQILSSNGIKLLGPNDIYDM